MAVQASLLLTCAINAYRMRIEGMISVECKPSSVQRSMSVNMFMKVNKMISAYSVLLFMSVHSLSLIILHGSV